ncbi:MAG: hypothetical protein ACFCA4_09750 [Cyanophyceae cyanobacterium]
MKLKSRIDKDIQIDLMFHRITFPVDKKGKILIHQFRIDTQAGAGMLYIKPKEKLPRGKLPFLVVDAEDTYGVFHFNGEAAMIEISTLALEGAPKDFYRENQK